ncbi:uncharacterized protein LOC142055599 [Phalacrocorax aristotelis]|uniref:uncharacterized protein LOC142055599 n=1 Tax=Phalacrocorax aristotelis TaxID=126867 RepID=UPI003F4B9EC2
MVRSCRSAARSRRAAPLRANKAAPPPPPTAAAAAAPCPCCEPSGAELSAALQGGARGGPGGRCCLLAAAPQPPAVPLRPGRAGARLGWCAIGAALCPCPGLAPPPPRALPCPARRAARAPPSAKLPAPRPTSYQRVIWVTSLPPPANGDARARPPPRPPLLSAVPPPRPAPTHPPRGGRGGGRGLPPPRGGASPAGFGRRRAQSGAGRGEARRGEAGRGGPVGPPRCPSPPEAAEPRAARGGGRCRRRAAGGAGAPRPPSGGARGPLRRERERGQSRWPPPSRRTAPRRLPLPAPRRRVRGTALAAGEVPLAARSRWPSHERPPLRGGTGAAKCRRSAAGASVPRPTAPGARLGGGEGGCEAAEQRPARGAPGEGGAVCPRVPRCPGRPGLLGGGARCRWGPGRGEPPALREGPGCLPEKASSYSTMRLLQSARSGSSDSG